MHATRKICQFALVAITACLLAVQPAWAGKSITERVTYYHYDGLGSVIAATDEKGAPVWHEDYLSYGERFTRDDDGRNTLWFTGKLHEDEIGLSYFGARWYDPTTGRFTGIDPVGVDAENLHSFNRYAYANNNPYKYVDPDGRAAESILDAGFVTWDLGNVIGAGAAWIQGKISGDDTLARVASSGIREQGLNLGADAAALIVPGLPAGVTRVVGGAKKAIVIGENMKDRVIPTAKSIGADYYKPRTTKGDLLKKDLRWIDDKMRKGREVIDIGPDPKRAKRSEFYREEKQRMKKRNYPVTRLNIDG